MSIRGVTTVENDVFLGIRLPNFLIDPDEFFEGKLVAQSSVTVVLIDVEFNICVCVCVIFKKLIIRQNNIILSGCGAVRTHAWTLSQTGCFASVFFFFFFCFREDTDLERGLWKFSFPT